MAEHLSRKSEVHCKGNECEITTKELQSDIDEDKKLRDRSESPKLEKNPGMYDLLAHVKHKASGPDAMAEDESKTEAVIRVQNFDRGDEPTV